MQVVEGSLILLSDGRVMPADWVLKHPEVWEPVTRLYNIGDEVKVLDGPNSGREGPVIMPVEWSEAVWVPIWFEDGVREYEAGQVEATGNARLPAIIGELPGVQEYWKEHDFDAKG